MKLDLIFTMRDVYINSNLDPFAKFSTSSRSTKYKDIFLWNICQVITNTVPISKKIVISCAFEGKLLETDTTT